MKWTTFLAGLAIGLWIAVVVLFLWPREQTPPYVVQYGAPGAPAVHAKTLWIPSGDGVYRCTNNDHGGGVVEDHGRGVVEDHGRGTVEDHGGGVVEDHGGGVVEDGAAHVPAPTGNRGYQEYWCDLNPAGGPLVRDRSGRIVVVAMPTEPGYQCRRDANGHASVWTAVEINGETRLRKVDVDHGGGVVEDHGRGTVEDSGGGVEAPPVTLAGLTPDVPAGADRHYCMVANADSAPVIVDADGNLVQ